MVSENEVLKRYWGTGCESLRWFPNKTELCTPWMPPRQLVWLHLIRRWHQKNSSFLLYFLISGSIDCFILFTRCITLQKSYAELVLAEKQMKSPVSTSKKTPHSFSQQYKHHQHETCAYKGWRSEALGRQRNRTAAVVWGIMQKIGSW